MHQSIILRGRQFEFMVETLLLFLLNIVLNNFVRNHYSYGQYLKNWPLIEREKLPIPPPLKFPHREGEKMVRQAIIGGRFL